MVETRVMSSQERMGCGYFCFFHELDKFYVNEGSFACRYIPPSSVLSNIDISSGLSVWDSTIKVISVETYCQSIQDHSDLVKKDQIEQVSKSEKEYFEEKEIQELKEQLNSLSNQLEKEKEKEKEQKDYFDQKLREQHRASEKMFKEIMEKLEK